MTNSPQNKYFCPRLVDYVVIVGSRHPNRNNQVAQTPELLRRYPVEDHRDFPLPPDVVFFCQPEGCISVGPKRTGLRESTSFVFTLTEKDSGRIRYGMCVNFYRPFERKTHIDRTRSDRSVGQGSTSSGEQSNLGVPTEDEDRPKSPRTKRRQKTAGRVRNNTLTSLCIISHHPFFSTLRECLFVLRKLIDACNERSCTKRVGGSKAAYRDTVWGVLTGQGTDNCPSLVMHEVREIETWILRLLSAPVPVPGKTRVDVEIMTRDIQPSLTFALPDHTRFGLVDFPLHLPLELLGVETCLNVLTCIILEHKLVLQSRDYNALSMSVMAFVSMLYPLEYMFPVIPLLPTCMSSAEQLLLAPTPYIIGVPASFFLYKKGFMLPDDVWLIDLDSNKINPPRMQSPDNDLPPFPEPEGTILKNHLKQALASMSMSPQPIQNLDTLTQNPDMWKRRESFSSQTGFNPLIYGNDVDSVDVATRVAMVRFFNSPNILGNFTEHTRTLRLYPRPVVAFQMNSFLKSRPLKTMFTSKLARTQAVEYFAEWALCPSNLVFLRVQTGVFDPLLIGDKAKWFSQGLQKIDFKVYDHNSSLGAAITSAMNTNTLSDENPTDESGSDSDGAESTSSSYSSLSDFVTDMVNSDISGDAPEYYAEEQKLTVEQSSVFSPPSQLQVPETDTPVTNSDSAFSMPESDDASSSGSSSPTYAPEPSRDGVPTIPDSQSDRPHSPSLISAISSELNGYAQSASSTFSELFDNEPVHGSTKSMPNIPATKQQRPFAPLGNRKALVEKSGLVKHASSKRQRDVPRQQSTESRTNTHSENQQFLKDVISDVMDGKGLGWLKVSKVKKLMEDENYRNFVVSRLNLQMDKKVTDEDVYLDDVHVTKQVYKGMLAMLKCLIYGLEHTYQNHGLGGMASVYVVLEIAHTHYWLKESLGSNKSDSGTSRGSSPFGSRESLCTIDKADSRSLQDEHMVAALGSPVVVNGDEFENIELRKANDPALTPHGTIDPNYKRRGQTILDSMERDVDNNRQKMDLELNKNFENLSLSQQCDIIVSEAERRLAESGQTLDLEAGDILRELVKNKELMKSRRTDLLQQKFGSLDSEISEASTLVSTSSDTVGNGEEVRKRSRINHHSIRSTVSDSEMETVGLGANLARKKRSPSIWSTKSNLSTGFRYHDGKMINVTALPSPDSGRTYLFEGLTGSSRPMLWDQMQFWEDAFLDAVAQERDIIGMDQGPGEMMERYNSLGDVERKRLEQDEDRLLSIILYNTVAFMVMMKCVKQESKKKSRRLLGKSHIGLIHSQEVNDLLDQIGNLHGNDIDLKPMGSRMMQKQSFTVHWGTDNTGDMLFMEVCDDCIILRTVTGAICDRWWYEKLINMTYCPKTKVLCLWRKRADQTQLNQFYTKKCRELYFCVKEAMEKAASRNNGKIPGPELGGEFPVQDMKTGQGGLLQVCMEGIGLLFANSKFFVELSRIKKCFTQKGAIFVLEEFDPKTRKVVQRKYKSKMADQICYAVLCVFSYVAAGMEQQQQQRQAEASQRLYRTL